ncbi:hypothetical protein C3F09_02300 [candidate division GN15 bacterium]|uniref:PKD domain-containing protein n=1 Tax=candidate division GN15 bacterium TaxID=2072418 RepID=A0A855X4B4_9BACT|nr:MAG: hypothetical protein C3F09_02300 [candidate division GN15 bacterium]
MVQKLLLLGILMSLTAGLFVAVGCDKLITQVNNNTVYDSTLGEDCKRCHGDDDKIIRIPLAQWQNSRHASSGLIEATIDYGGQDYVTSTCGKRCHTSEGFKKYVAGDSTSAVTGPSVVDCFTCHLPHTGDYGDWRMDTLRGERPTTDLGNFTYYGAGKSNQCAICHMAAHVPIFATAPGTVRLDTIGPDGPHNSAQANIMIGTGGVRFGTATITNSHGTVNDSLKNGCLSCHFGSGLGYDFGEHTFKLLDQNSGIQYVANCNVAGCHSGSPATVTDLFDGTAFPRLDSIRALGDSIKNLLLAYPILTGADTDTTAFFRDSTVPSDAAKILFNYLLYKKDGSRGVHNAKYTLQLLKESAAQWDSVPKAIIEPSVARGCIGVSVDFANLSHGAVTTSTWDFGDGTTPEQLNGIADGVHPFMKSGSFTVKLTLDGSSGRAVATVAIVVDTTPTAQFVMTADTVYVDSVVTFTDQSTGQPTTWSWDFGDGVGTSTEQNPQYTYTTTGLFDVRLIAGNACGVDTLIDTIIVTTPTPQVMGKR